MTTVREVAFVETSVAWYHIDAEYTSARCDLSIFDCQFMTDKVCVAITDYTALRLYDYSYLMDRNCLDLIRSNAPVSIVIDALLEVRRDQWRGHGWIDRTIKLLEAIALMDLLPHKGPPAY